MSYTGKPKPWLTIQEASERHDVSTDKLYRLCREDKIEWNNHGIMKVRNQSLTRFLKDPANSKPGPKGGTR